ncbi:unnamed protein product [Tuber melanosporum]|uniref:(Perigord truffle) hypothetical protein n=1 Tax=Tuber melanosporum (strain Mel28) TaxID=656061 RepID=D5GB20_TUBMM|nr:uncharacterized protein GSTUM_00005406001 [Tuber melanosporum]CAZ81713.1 unnamed protein product [Tuber melanosporum]
MSIRMTAQTRCRMEGSPNLSCAGLGIVLGHGALYPLEGMWSTKVVKTFATLLNSVHHPHQGGKRSSPAGGASDLPYIS